MSRNLRTIFLPPAPKMYHNVDKTRFRRQGWNYTERIIIFEDFIDV